MRIELTMWYQPLPVHSLSKTCRDRQTDRLHSVDGETDRQTTCMSLFLLKNMQGQTDRRWRDRQTDCRWRDRQTDCRWRDRQTDCTTHYHFTTSHRVQRASVGLSSRTLSYSSSFTVCTHMFTHTHTQQNDVQHLQGTITVIITAQMLTWKA